MIDKALMTKEGADRMIKAALKLQGFTMVRHSRAGRRFTPPTVARHKNKLARVARRITRKRDLS